MTDAIALHQIEVSERRDALQQYSVESIDNGTDLVCTFANRCKASTKGRGEFAPGQLSHVGSSYDLEVGGHPLRILVVPMQTARDEHHVTMDQRTEQIDSAKPTSARSFPRTPHMDGTAIALKVLLGMDPEADDEVEPGLHVFDCFAMTNATHCTNVIDGKTGVGTREMYELCTRHMRRTIALLQPTIIVCQGWQKTGESPSSSVTRALGVPKPARGTCIPAKTSYGTVAVVALNHPARHWPSPDREMFRDEVEPALKRARDIAVG